VDILGLYTMVFENGNDKGEKWNMAEVGLVFGSFSSVYEKLGPFVKLVNDARLKALRLPKACKYKEAWVEAVCTLANQMGAMNSDLRGGRVLTIIKKPISYTKKTGPKIAQSWFSFLNKPLWVMQLSIPPKQDFFSATPDQRRDSIFHELSHFYGTEDEPPFRIQNADYLEDIFSAESPSLRLAKQEFKDKYGEAGCPKDSRDDKY
jgi:hypothetical protein